MPLLVGLKLPPSVHDTASHSDGNCQEDPCEQCRGAIAGLPCPLPHASSRRGLPQGLPIESTDTTPRVSGLHVRRGGMPLLRRNCNDRSGSKARITAPQHCCPLRLNKQTLTERVQCDAMCRYCCKSPKLPGANFLAVKKSDRRPSIDVASITLPRSPASLSSGNEVPHIFTRKSCVQPKEILITSAKRLLQQNLPLAEVVQCNRLCVNGWPAVAVGMRVTSHPPHRSVRAAFPHTAPTLSL